MKKILLAKSESETIKAGESLGKILKSGDIVSVNGELGAGKTVFVKGIAKALDISECITSPTFALVNEYFEGKIPLYHFDVYRINDPFELYETGFDEYIYSNGVTVIEWGNMVENILPEDIIKVEIKRIDEKDLDTRKITVIRKEESK